MKIRNNNTNWDVKKILEEYDLCDDCLGRLASKKTSMIPNNLLGKRIKKGLQKRQTKKCYICKNLISNLKQYISKTTNLSKEYQYENFLLGTTLKPSILDKDDLIRSKFRLIGVDSIKTAITKQITNQFSKKTRKKIEYQNPDLTIIINFKNNSLKIYSKPVFLYGRYLKNKRGITQKQKSCSVCLGKGCRSCNYYGISGLNSIEGRISKFLCSNFKAKQAKISWIGGEGKDSLVLGNGRPFFVKVINPKARKVKLSKKIHLNGVVIKNFKIIKLIPIDPLKFKSKIQANVITQNKIIPDHLNRLQNLTKSIIKIFENSKTTRKLIYELKYKQLSDTSFTILFTVEGGFPVKRFVEGNKINPSISEIFNQKCKCKEFDFNDVILEKQQITR